MQRERVRTEGGFSLVEVLVAMVVLSIVAAGIAAGMIQSGRVIGAARETTTAQSLAESELDSIRRAGYANVGTVGGNPSGAIAPSRTVTIQGTTYTIQVSVRYVDDQALGQARTYSNYKRVTVTVTGSGVNPKAATVSTQITPPSFSAIEGRGTIRVQVQDAFLLSPLDVVSVTVDGSTSPSQNELTDTTGQALFAGLLPSGSPPLDRYRIALTKAGYETTQASLDPGVSRPSLAANQVITPTLTMFRPSTIRVNVTDLATGAPIAGNQSVTVTDPSARTATQTGTGTPAASGQFDFTTLGGVPIEPSTAPTQVAVSAPCYVTGTAAAPVPSSYPGTLTRTFDVALAAAPTLTVTVVNHVTGLPVAGVPVTVSGGGPALPDTTSTTNAAGLATLCIPPSGATPYRLRAEPATGYGWDDVPLTMPGVNSAVTLRLGPAPMGTCTIRVTGLTAALGGNQVELQAVGYPGLAVSYDAFRNLSTDGLFRYSFPRLTPGTAYRARVANDVTGILWRAWTTAPITCTAGGTTNVVTP